MLDAPIHRATSTDGTEIAGRVHGEGPPLVFVHGGLGDGEVNWRYLTPLLEDRFTCCTMSTRGRGLSADGSDHSAERLIEDITSFTESIDRPVGLVTHSSGGALGLFAASQADNVAAVAHYEPALLHTRTDDEMEQAMQGLGGIGEALEAGRDREAARIFLEDLGLVTEREMEERRTQDELLDDWAPTSATSLQDATGFASAGPPPADLLDRLAMPTLLLCGADTHPSYQRGVEILASELPDATTHELTGTGHLAPQLRPDLVAEPLHAFFSDRLGED